MAEMTTDYDNRPNNYELSVDDDGVRHAVNALNSVSVLPDGASRLFQRRAIGRIGSSAPVYDTVLVGELNGVRVYVHGNSIVLTTQDLRL